MGRRMFSPKIVESDAFLDMPISTQALYFHLGMEADDDGFVNPRKIMRVIGASDDDLKVLLTKRFVLSFESGVIVIKHWKINNLVRKDFYRPTLYSEELAQLKTKTNGAYTDLQIENVNKVLTKCLPSIVYNSIVNTTEQSSEAAVSSNEKVWLLEDKLQDMEKKSGTDMDIIATFIREKDLPVENSKQLTAVIGRYRKTAQKLEGYSIPQIQGAIDKIREDLANRERRGGDTYDWTMETILKQLTK